MSEEYSTDQRRVAEYIVKLTGIGGGDDPIGFLMASHAVLVERLRAVERPADPRGWHEAIEAAAKVAVTRKAQHIEDRKRIAATPGHDQDVINACIAAEDEADEIAYAILALSPAPKEDMA